VFEQNRNPEGRAQARLPLFPGYLFLRGAQEALHGALDTKLVANCLEVSDQQQLTANLCDIHRLIESGGPLSREFHPSPGTRVRIIRGPLTGIEGTVTRSGKSLKFVVQVQFLQSGASVEVDASMVEPV
jgi:transcriptional antiterminator RfaH